VIFPHLVANFSDDPRIQLFVMGEWVKIMSTIYGYNGSVKIETENYFWPFKNNCLI
jgi:hypothetical protein